jgi:hypothetical protein
MKLTASRPTRKTLTEPWTIELRGLQALRLDRHCRTVRVIEGNAWLSYAGKDVFLRVGETLEFANASDDRVIGGFVGITRVELMCA